MAEVARFWYYVNVGAEDECWLWTGGGKRYGKFKVNYVGHAAHRYSYELANGPIPDGLYVCHRCDTPKCVNPRHLFVGTSSDNMLDASSKGRINGKKNGFYGRSHTSESRSKMSDSLRGKKYPRVTCDRCGQATSAQNFSRHRCLPDVPRDALPSD